MTDMTEFKTLLDKQGEAFEAFKQTHDELKANDALTSEKLTKIEKSLDAAVEAKAALERAIKAERKEREDLEARINRLGVKSTSEAGAKRELEVKEFNQVLAANAAARTRSVTPLDEKGYDEYKAAWDKWAREGQDRLMPEEVKTLSVGSDPDGGYFVTPDVTGRIATKVYETSLVRQYASVHPLPGRSQCRAHPVPVPL